MSNHFNPENPQHLQRLSYAVDWSRFRLQAFREHRLHALKEYVGYHYSESGSEDRVPVNLLQLGINIYLRQLVARAPRAAIRSKLPMLIPLAANAQAWMDTAIDGMNLCESLRRWVLDAMFSMGVMAIGCYKAGDVEIQGILMEVGQPFAEPVDQDDWVHDILSKKWGNCEYMGHRYRVRLEAARENKNFDKEAREKISPGYRYVYNENGDLRPLTLSQGTSTPYDEVVDHCELWDIWMPEEGIVVTIPHNDQPAQSWAPLQVKKWTGRREGPYEPLGFVDVPDNIMPAAPATSWMDLHDLTNRVWRKLGRQAERQKTVTLVDGRSVDDGVNVMNANDGDTIRVNRPEGTKELRYGGVDQGNFLFAESLRQIFDFMAGNLSSLGGLAPQAQTASQDKMLNASASAQLSEMQDRTIAATRKVYKALARYWWDDPVRTYTATRDIEGVSVPVVIPPQLRKIPFEALEWDIDPYSMPHDTPQTRLAGMMQVLERVAMPAMGQMAQQGVTIKWPDVFKVISEYGNMPELARILNQGPPPDQEGAAQQMGQAQQAPMPSNTSRTHVRENRPTTTDKGNSIVMRQLLAKAVNGSNGVPAQGGKA